VRNKAIWNPFGIQHDKFMRLFKIIYTCCSVLFCSSLLLRAEKLSSEELKTLSVLRGSVTIAVDEIDHRFVESNIGWDTLTVSPFSQMSMSYRYVMKTRWRLVIKRVVGIG